MTVSSPLRTALSPQTGSTRSLSWPELMNGFGTPPKMYSPSTHTDGAGYIVPMASLRTKKFLYVLDSKGTTLGTITSIPFINAPCPLSSPCLVTRVNLLGQNISSLTVKSQLWLPLPPYAHAPHHRTAKSFLALSLTINTPLLRRRYILHTTCHYSVGYNS